MISNNIDIANLGITGFLMKKTVQPFSLRQESLNSASDFKNSNMLLFINKKLANIRQRIGTNLIPFDFLSNPCMKIKPQKKSLEEMRNDVYDTLEKEIKIHKDKVKLSHRRYNTPKSKSEEKKQEICKILSKTARFPPEKKICQVLHNSITENDLLTLYYQYKLKKRNDITNNNVKNFASPEITKNLELFDDRKILKELSTKFQFDLPKILGLDQTVISEFIMQDADTIEKTKKIEDAKNLRLNRGKLSTFEIANLMVKDDSKCLTQSIQNFNSTRLENINMEKTKKKKVQTSQSFFFKLKEKNEQLDQQNFNEHVSDIHNKSIDFYYSKNIF